MNGQQKMRDEFSRVDEELKKFKDEKMATFVKQLCGISVQTQNPTYSNSMNILDSIVYLKWNCKFDNCYLKYSPLQPGLRVQNCGAADWAGQAGPQCDDLRVFSVVTGPSSGSQHRCS